MGAYIALLAAAAEPGPSDGWYSSMVASLPPPPEGISVDDALTATLGPAIDRLSTTFESEQAYVDFFRSHPALTADWNDDIAAYVRYDLTGEPGRMRSRVVGDAVREDGRDVLVLAEDYLAAWDALKVPTVLLCAPRGMFGQAARPPLRWSRRGSRPPTPRDHDRDRGRGEPLHDRARRPVRRPDRTPHRGFEPVERNSSEGQ